MKRYALILCAAFGLMLSSGQARADWASLHYSGYQPWWNIFAKRPKCMTPEEERLQKFWHDYYDAMGRYYQAMDHIDWVAYYKNHGYQINGGCYGPGGGPCRVNYAPVFVSPTMFSLSYAGQVIIWVLVGRHKQRPTATPAGQSYGGPPIQYGRFIEIDEDDDGQP